MAIRSAFKLVITLLLLFSANPLHALDLPPVPNTYVYDAASLISPAAKQQLEAALERFDKETSNQILVAVFPNLQGETIEEFSIRLAEKWKPGQKKHDNGALLVVAKEERGVRIEVGYGLEGVLTDALSKSIIENDIVPAFKKGDFDQGLMDGVKAIMQATAGEYKPAESPSDSSLRDRLVGFFIALVFFWLLLSISRSRRYHGIRGSGWYGGWGGGSGGGWSGGSSSGGFSSGGGSFGGGGASGRW
jgi:uncharacterized protein